MERCRPHRSSRRRTWSPPPSPSLVPPSLGFPLVMSVLLGFQLGQLRHERGHHICHVSRRLSLGVIEQNDARVVMSVHPSILCHTHGHHHNRPIHRRDPVIVSHRYSLSGIPRNSASSFATAVL